MYRFLILAGSALFTVTSLLATSIIPFTSLGHMLEASEFSLEAKVVGTYEYQDGETTFFGYELQPLTTIKGVSTGDVIRFQVASITNDADGNVSQQEADLALTLDKNYLFFLRSGTSGYIPLTSALGVYLEEKGEDGEDYFVPMPTFDINLMEHPSGELVEPRLIYKRQELLDRLALRMDNSQVRVEKAATSLEYADFPVVMAMPSPPAQCNSFTSTFNGTRPELAVRWPSSNITIFHNAENPSVRGSNAHALVQQMVASLNANYGGLNITYGGITAIGGNQCINDARAAGGGNSITIAFQNSNVCMQTGLNNCSGTLGIGGPSWNSAVNTASNGVEYYSIVTGGVVIDQDAGCLLTTGDYIRLLEHEVTHALGFQHITTQNANMNPNCCVVIQQADIECLDFVYNSVPLPVELLAFDATDAGKEVEVNWSTASEVSSKSFAVQRSADGDFFETIGEVDARGNSNVLSSYSYKDFFPLSGVSYYRLTQEDLDGTQETFDVVALTRKTSDQVLVSPNPVKAGGVLVMNGLSQQVHHVSLINSAGQLVISYTMEAVGGQLQIALPQDLPTGLYFLRSSSNEEVISQVIQVGR